MLLSLFIKAWLVGVSIAMPIGPIGFLCIHHTLVRGLFCGLMAGLGVALADTIYGVLAGLGITILTSFLNDNQIWFQLSAGMFLSYLGIRTLWQKPGNQEGMVIRTSTKRIFTTTFLLTLANPLTILSFAVVYAGLGVGLNGRGIIDILILTIGIFTGSIIWWMILSYGISLFGKSIQVLDIRILNKISGWVILLIGISISLTVFFPFKNT